MLFHGLDQLMLAIEFRIQFSKLYNSILKKHFDLFFRLRQLDVYLEYLKEIKMYKIHKNIVFKVCTYLIKRLTCSSVRLLQNSLHSLVNWTFTLLKFTVYSFQICDDSITAKTYIDNMIVGCAFLVGFAIQGALLNPLGRKNVLLAALAIGTLSGILLHFVVNTQAVLVLFCLYILMPGLSISVMCGAMVDLVPTQLRWHLLWLYEWLWII